jgi:hypothetical protein
MLAVPGFIGWLCATIEIAGVPGIVAAARSNTFTHRDVLHRVAAPLPRALGHGERASHELNTAAAGA